LRFGGVALLGDRTQEASGHGLASLSPKSDGNSISELATSGLLALIPPLSRVDSQDSAEAIYGVFLAVSAPKERVHVDLGSAFSICGRTQSGHVDMPRLVYSNLKLQLFWLRHLRLAGQFK